MVFKEQIGSPYQILKSGGSIFFYLFFLISSIYNGETVQVSSPTCESACFWVVHDYRDEKYFQIIPEVV